MLVLEFDELFKKYKQLNKSEKSNNEHYMIEFLFHCTQQAVTVNSGSGLKYFRANK